MRKYGVTARFVPQVIMQGHMRGYFQVFDSWDNKVVATGFMSEEEAYHDAFYRNEEIVKRASKDDLAKVSREWLDLTC